jgi:hypothetical protein
MDIDVIDRRVADLMKFKARAEPMLRAWEEHVARERLGGTGPAPTEAQTAAQATVALTHAKNIARILAKPPAKRK